MSDALYNAAGILGSLITALAILPQIVLVVRRGSSADISYAYQAVFVVGIGCFLIYYGYYHLWEVFFPTTLSAAMMLSLVGLKFYYEGSSPSRTAAVATAGEDGVERSARAKNAGRTSEMQPLMSSW
eukprot:g7663.t1